MAIEDASGPLPILGDGAAAPSRGWFGLLSPNERAAYELYRRSEMRLLECIEGAAADLHGHWRAQGQRIEDGRGADSTLAEAAGRAQAMLDELYAQLRLVRSLREAVEQEALKRLAASERRR